MRSHRSPITVVLSAVIGLLLGAVGAPPATAAETVTVVMSATPTSVTSGAGVALTATVSSATTATGTVRWYYSTDGGTTYVAWTGNDATLQAGRATRTWWSHTPTARWRWKARYLGDATHAARWSGTSVRVSVRSPDLPIRYAAGSSASWFAGLAFDKCTAPSVAQLTAWGASPYRAVAVYVSGSQRFCAQPELTREWVAAVTALGWRIIPVHMGFQPTCTRSNKQGRYTYASAHSVGTSEAQEAVRATRALGMLSGTAIYADVELYDPEDSTCRLSVLRYVSAWTAELHRLGRVAGAYVHASSGIPHLSQAIASGSYAGPDAVWMARWDGVASTTNWTQLPDSQWAVHQRVKQYRGDHSESWGGVSMTIDSNVVDGPVAVVGQPFQVAGTSSLNARTGPSGTWPVVRAWPAGSTLTVVCQGPGMSVGGTRVWDLLADGTWVSDRYVSTPSKTTYSPGLPRCAWPGAVTASPGLTARTGPGASYPTTGSRLPFEALAWVTCQRAGSKVGSTWVWDRLADGRWVSDYHVRNASNTTWSPPAPRC